MSNEFRREIERIVERMKSELDALIKRINEMVNRGEIRGAYRAWTEGIVDILKETREALKKLESYAKEAGISETEIEESLEYLRREIREALARMDREASRLRSYWERDFLSLILVPPNIVGSVRAGVEDIVESINKFIEHLQRSLTQYYSRMAQVVSLRMREKDLEVIDQLVEAGIFKSRSEAVAYFVRKGMESSREWINRALEQAKKIRELQESARRELEEHGE